MEPVMTYRIGLPEGCDVHHMYEKLCQLEEEEPQLHLVWKEQLNEIHPGRSRTANAIAIVRFRTATAGTAGFAFVV